MIDDTFNDASIVELANLVEQCSEGCRLTPALLNELLALNELFVVLVIHHVEHHHDRQRSTYTTAAPEDMAVRRFSEIQPDALSALIPVLKMATHRHHPGRTAYTSDEDYEGMRCFVDITFKTLDPLRQIIRERQRATGHDSTG